MEGHNSDTTVRIETTSPIWRVIAVMFTAGAVAVFGFYLNEIGYGDDFATVSVITLGFTVSFWAHKRPDRLRLKFGPFGKVANALKESIDDIREWTYTRPLRVGAAIAVAYGLTVVIAKNIFIGIFQLLYSWHLAVAFGLLVGAAVASPSMFPTLLKNMTRGLQSDPGVKSEDSQQIPHQEKSPESAQGL